MEYHRASIHLQTYQLMLYVKERFSDVLLSAENITKLELLGKGITKINHEVAQKICDLVCMHACGFIWLQMLHRYIYIYVYIYIYTYM